MAGLDVAWIPFGVMYLLYLLPPTMMEIYSYYTRGGLVRFEEMKYDDTFMKDFVWYNDRQIYGKRFLDRPKSEAARAFYGYLDWSAEAYDKSTYIYRRNCARRDGEVSYWFKFYIYGPFVFNWPKKLWLRGDDAASWLMPAWGDGGEERGRAEYADAKSRGLNKHYHYQIMRRIRRTQAFKAQQQQAVTTPVE